MFQRNTIQIEVQMKIEIMTSKAVEMKHELTTRHVQVPVMEIDQPTYVAHGTINFYVFKHKLAIFCK